MPPLNGKAGKFLDEERPLSDYPAESYGDHLDVRNLTFLVFSFTHFCDCIVQIASNIFNATYWLSYLLRKLRSITCRFLKKLGKTVEKVHYSEVSLNSVDTYPS